MKKGEIIKLIGAMSMLISVSAFTGLLVGCITVSILGEAPGQIDLIFKIIGMFAIPGIILLFIGILSEDQPLVGTNEKNRG